MADTKKRVRGWVFTLNNYDANDEDRLQRISQAKYIVYGRETAPTTGTPHLQGYIELQNPKNFNGMAKYLNLKGIHLEPRKGSPKEASDYCKKGGDFFEIGTLPMDNGVRRGFSEACKAVLDGKSIEEIACDYPEEYVRYSSGLKSLATVKVKPRDPKNPPEVIWLWGLAGTGKTRRAYEAHEKSYIKDGTQWWDGYDGQEAIIIDDFEAIEWNYRDFLRLLDRYPYRGQFKGGYVNVNSPHIYITCEYHPSKIWTGNKLAQVTRRLTKIIEVTAQGTSAQGDQGNTMLGHLEGENEPIFQRLVKTSPM